MKTVPFLLALTLAVIEVSGIRLCAADDPTAESTADADGGADSAPAAQVASTDDPQEMLREIRREVAEMRRDIERLTKLLEDRQSTTKTDAARTDPIEARVNELVANYDRLFQESRFHAAEEVAVQAKQLKPDDPKLEVMLWKARLARRNADKQDGEPSDADPHGLDAAESTLLDLVRQFAVLMRQGRYASAELVSKQAQEMAPDDPIGETLLLVSRIAQKREIGTALREDRGTLRIKQRLRKPISVAFEKAPLREVIKKIATDSDINFVLDNLGLEEGRVDIHTPVTAKLDQVRLDEALTTILEPLHLGWTVEDDVVKIVSRARLAKEIQVSFTGPAGMQVRVVGDSGDPRQLLVAPATHKFRQDATYRLKLSNIPGHDGLDLNSALKIHPAHPVTNAFVAQNSVRIVLTDEDLDQLQSNNSITKVFYLPNPRFQELAVADVETLVSTRLDPGVDPIAEVNRRGTIIAVLQVSNSDTKVSKATTSREARRGEIFRRLQQPISVEFENEPLREAIKTIAAKSGVNLALDERGLKEEGVTSEQLITKNLNDVPVDETLRTILEPLGLARIVRDNFVEITSRARARGPLLVITYDVSDLTKGENAGSQLEMLVELIVSTVEPASWSEVGGEGSIKTFESKQSLIIRQTEGGHVDIAKLLEQLRQLRRATDFAYAGDSNDSAKHPQTEQGVSARPPGPSIRTQKDVMIVDTYDVQDLVSDDDNKQGQTMLLAKFIMATVEPDTWESAGGEGKIRSFDANRALVIGQTEIVHDKIAELLSKLRRLLDFKVELQCRLVSRIPESLWNKLRGRTGAEGPLIRLSDRDGSLVLTEMESKSLISELQGNEQTNLVSLQKLLEVSGGEMKLPGRWEQGGQPIEVRLRPVISVDRRTAALWLSAGKRSFQFPSVPDGQSVLLDLTDSLDAVTVGVPVAGHDKLFTAVRRPKERMLVLITPRIVVAEEKEDLVESPK